MTGASGLLLAGGGHSHALLLKRWAMQPQRRPPQNITLVNRCSTTLYSGMVPGLIAGMYQRDELAIDLRQLCDRAGVWPSWKQKSLDWSLSRTDSSF